MNKAPGKHRELFSCYIDSAGTANMVGDHVNKFCGRRGIVQGISGHFRKIRAIHPPNTVDDGADVALYSLVVAMEDLCRGNIDVFLDADGSIFVKNHQFDSDAKLPVSTVIGGDSKSP